MKKREKNILNAFAAYKAYQDTRSIFDGSDGAARVLKADAERLLKAPPTSSTSTSKHHAQSKPCGVT